MRWMPGCILAVQPCTAALVTSLTAQAARSPIAGDLQLAVSEQFGRPYVEVRVGEHPSAGRAVRVVITDSLVVTAPPARQRQAAREVAVFVSNRFSENARLGLIVVGWSWSQDGGPNQLVLYHFLPSDLAARDNAPPSAN